MEVCKINQANSVRNLIEDNNEQHCQCLEKYNQDNKHFSLNEILFNDNQQEKQMIAYHWIYQYENSQIKIEYFLKDGIWKIIPDQFNLKEQEKLNILLDDLHINRNLSLDQQIQIIIQRFDHHFHELNQQVNIQQNPKVISFILEEDDEEINKYIDRSKQSTINKNISTSSPILQLDQEQQLHLPLQSLTSDSQQKRNNLTPIIKSNRIRQDSSCSSANSIKYVQFVPPSMTTICQRRVIQSILLSVQRKKNIFEKVLHTLKHVPSEPTMYELGLRFLHIYDGKFNYPQGYTFAIPFQRRTWFLTIINIKCIQCQLGQQEPRSVLILKYKNQFTTVQV